MKITTTVMSFFEKAIISPYKYSIWLTLLIFAFTKTIVVVCWEGCSYGYLSIFPVLLSPMTFIFGGFILPTIKFLVVFFAILFILKNKKTQFFGKLFLIALFTFILVLLQNYIFYNFTPEGRYISASQEKEKQIENDLQKIGTKSNVINYFKRQNEYVDVVCENTTTEGIAQIPHVIVYEKEVGKKGGILVGPNSVSGLVYERTYFCDVTMVKGNNNYDCIFFRKEGTEGGVCFENNETRYIFVYDEGSGKTKFLNSGFKQIKRAYKKDIVIIEKWWHL